MFKRAIGLAIVAVGIAIFLPVSAVVAAGKPPGKGGQGNGNGEWKYTALGDSLANGLLAFNGYVFRYKEYVQQDTGATIELTNLGQNGWKSEDLRTALQTDRKLRRHVSRSQVITWNVGGNDLKAARDRYKAGTCGGPYNQNCLTDTLTAFEQNWDDIIHETLKLRNTSKAVVRTMNVYNPYVNRDKIADSWKEDGDECVDLDDDGLCNDFEIFKPFIDKLNLVMCAKATENRIPCADVYEAFNGTGDDNPLNNDRDPGYLFGYISIDGLHPNDTGHRVIAELLRGLGYSPLK